MTEESGDPKDAPELRTIRQLVKLMQRYDLTAIDLGDGPARIRLRRRGAETALLHASPVVPHAAPSVAPGVAPVSAAAIPTAPAPEAAKGVFIESPMVGTFYLSSAPDSPPFVNVGSAVRADSTVCIIEAMKVFTDIPAGLSGTILEILVKNGQAVEYGQPLFRIEPA